MPLGMEVGLDQGHTVLDEEDPAPSTERDTAAPTFAIYGEWRPYKPRPTSIVAKRLDGSGNHLPLGTEVGLDPGNILSDRDPAPRH